MIANAAPKAAPWVAQDALHHAAGYGQADAGDNGCCDTGYADGKDDRVRLNRTLSQKRPDYLRNGEAG